MCFVKGRVSKVDVSCVHLLFAQAQTLAKSLEVDNFPLSQKTDDVVDIWVIGKAENVIIGEAGLLLGRQVFSQVGNDIAGRLDRAGAPRELFEHG